MEIELLCEENRRLKQKNKKLRKENGELRQTVRELEKAKKELEEELAEEKKPDIKPKQRKEERKKSGRKKDHKGESREKPDQVDEEVSLDPLQVCPDCGGEVSEPQEWRERYREEIVLPQYRVTKFEIPRSYCSTCDKLVEPETEGILPKRQLGNKLSCYVVYLREELRLPDNMVQKHLENLGIKVSDGTVEKICSEAAEILEPHYEQLKEEIRKAKATNNDETGKRIEGENCWEWVFAKSDTIVFHSDKRRSHDVMEEQYGKKPKPVLGSDCYNAYNPLDGMKQRCWSPVRRQFGSRRGGGRIPPRRFERTLLRKQSERSRTPTDERIKCTIL